LLVELVVVHGVLFVATRTTRKGALFGFLAPWAVLALVTLPQFSPSPREVLLILLVPVLTFACHMIVEQARDNGEVT
jgi:hypothetical protein